MKISELVKNLQQDLDKYGDIDLYYYEDIIYIKNEETIFPEWN